MSELRCPHCGGELGERGVGELACASCACPFSRAGTALDLRADAAVVREPEPLPLRPLQESLRALERGMPFKAALEQLLLTLEDETAERAMLLLREGRGSWSLLARPGAGSALIAGNALSGTAVPLAQAGFEVMVLDPSPERARFGDFRNRALAPGRTRAVIGGDGPRLPFADRCFDLVVQEERGAAALAEHARVCRGELVVVADNRFGYKRSAGRRGHFRVPGPLEYARRALWPRAGERSLGRWRKLLAFAGFERARAFALYPDAREFSHVVALDSELPRLTIGPKERENRLKIAAHRAGLFPWLTPSFALFTARSAAPVRERAARVLAALAERTHEPEPVVDQWIATRGNTAVLLTALADARPDAASDPRGRWCVHVPLSPQQRDQIERHHAALTTLRSRFPRVPVPEPLFLGELEGVFFACERRCAGVTAPALTGDLRAAAALFADAARHLAELVVAPAAPLSERDFEALVGAKIDLVARFAHVSTTIDHLRRLRDELAHELVGVLLPRVYYHADLRSKHVQVRADGSVIGYLDWGSSVASDLPYFDLLHLIVHERKQESGLGAGEAWRIALQRERLRSHESAALDDYARALALEPRVCRAIERLYPVLVGAMAESNWDYSRPRWVHRQFGI